MTPQLALHPENNKEAKKHKTNNDDNKNGHKPELTEKQKQTRQIGWPCNWWCCTCLSLRVATKKHQKHQPSRFEDSEMKKEENGVKVQPLSGQLPIFGSYTDSRTPSEDPRYSLLSQQSSIYAEQKEHIFWRSRMSLLTKSESSE